MNNIVVDASIIVSAMYLDDKALLTKLKNLLRNNILYSPSLLKYEVGNAIGKLYEQDLNMRLSKSNKFQNLPINYCDLTSSEMEFAHKISISVGDSYYGSAYHSLALSRGYEFITLDEKYYRKAKDFGSIVLL